MSASGWEEERSRSSRRTLEEGFGKQWAQSAGSRKMLTILRREASTLLIPYLTEYNSGGDPGQREELVDHVHHKRWDFVSDESFVSSEQQDILIPSATFTLALGVT